MKLYRRVLLYIMRNRSRSLILLAIIFSMSAFITMGIAVKSSVDYASEDLRKSLGSSFILEVDENNPDNYGPVQEKDGYSYQEFIGPVIDQIRINKILDIEGVRDYYIDIEKLVWTELELRPGVWTEEVQYYRLHPELLEKHHYSSLEQIEVLSHKTSLLCCSDSEMHSYFRTGAFEIIDGRSLKKGDRFSAVISEELADKNGISIGDSFRIESKEGLYKPSQTPANIWGEPIELTIVGLFRANFEQEASPYTYEDGFVDNLIFSDMETARRIALTLQSYGMGSPEGSGYGKTTFFVEDPAMMDVVLAQVRSMDSTREFLLSLDDIAYRASVKPLQQMSAFSAFLIVISMLGIAVILFLVLGMWTKGRKREIGILLSLGYKKREIRLQFILECLAISILALAISFSFSNSMIQSFASMAEKMATADTQEENYRVEINEQFKPVVEKVSAEPVQLEYTLHWGSVILICALALGVSICSVCLATIQPLRMKPKEALTSL